MADCATKVCGQMWSIRCIVKRFRCDESSDANQPICVFARWPLYLKWFFSACFSFIICIWISRKLVRELVVLAILHWMFLWIMCVFAAICDVDRLLSTQINWLEPRYREICPGVELGFDARKKRNKTAQLVGFMYTSFLSKSLLGNRNRGKKS